MTLVTEKALTCPELVAGNVSALLAEAVAMVVEGVNTSDTVLTATPYSLFINVKDDIRQP